MANVNELPAASTPTTSRSASRARKAATAGTVAPVTTEVPAPAAPEGAAPVTTKRGRKIPERVESNNTTETAASAAPAEPTKLMVLAAKNPKRAGSKAATFFDFYYGADKAIHSTVEDAFSRGVRGKDLSWDRQRGHVLIGEDVDAYLALESDEARIEFMKSKGFDPKMAGFIIEVPAEVAQAVEQQVEGSEPAPVEA